MGSRLRINDEDNVIQDNKLKNIEELEGEVETLEVEVIKQGVLLNDTIKFVTEQFQRLTNVTEGEEKENEVEDSDVKVSDTETVVLESASPGNDAESCMDSDQHSSQCSGWTEKGECDSNPEFMSEQCKKSCGLCGGNGDPG